MPSKKELETELLKVRDHRKLPSFIKERGWITPQANAPRVIADIKPHWIRAHAKDLLRKGHQEKFFEKLYDRLGYHTEKITRKGKTYRIFPTDIRKKIGEAISEDESLLNQLQKKLSAPEMDKFVVGRKYTEQHLKQEILEAVKEKDFLSFSQLAEEINKSKQYLDTSLPTRTLNQLVEEREIARGRVGGAGGERYFVYNQPHKVLAANLWKTQEKEISPKAQLILDLKKNKSKRVSPSMSGWKNFFEELTQKFPKIFEMPTGNEIKIKDEKRFNEMYRIVKEVLRMKGSLPS